ncbi:hypothetical protein [Glutamicibacter soli]
MSHSTITHINWVPTVASIEAEFDRYAPVAPAAYSTLKGIDFTKLPQIFKSSSNRVWKDAVLRELINASVHQHDAFADVTILKLMLPKAVKMSHSCRSMRFESHADAIQTAIVAMWEATHTRSYENVNNVQGSLALNALHLVSYNDFSRKRSGTHDDQSIPTDDYGLLESAMNAQHCFELQESQDPLDELAEVLSWARHANVLTEDEVTLLARYSLAEDEQASRKTLEDELGINRQALSRRVSRIRLRLTQAIKDEIKANGWG